MNYDHAAPPNIHTSPASTITAMENPSITTTASTPNLKRPHDQSESGQRPKMRIYAAGCNAWRNLIYNQPRYSETSIINPEDIFTFTLADEGDAVSWLRAFLSWTDYVIDGKFKSLGDGPRQVHPVYTMCSAQDGAGRILRKSSKDNRVVELWTSLRHLIERERAEGSGHNPNREHSSELYPQRADTTPCSEVWRTAAWASGFIMMDTENRVYTMGDPRFSACLGRPCSEELLHDKLIMVEDLPDPIEKTKKVVAGGYTVAALTVLGHLYVWGISNPGSSGLVQAIPNLQGLPNYEPIGDDEDLIDVALGDSHAVVLTENREVYVRGSNRNGQLGLGWQRNQSASEWTKVELDLGDYQVEEVVAGPSSTFLIARLREGAPQAEEPRVARPRTEEPQAQERVG